MLGRKTNVALAALALVVAADCHFVSGFDKFEFVEPGGGGATPEGGAAGTGGEEGPVCQPKDGTCTVSANCCSQQCAGETCACECNGESVGHAWNDNHGDRVEAACGTKWSHCRGDDWYGCTADGLWSKTGDACSATPCTCVDGIDYLGNRVDAPCGSERVFCNQSFEWIRCGDDGAWQGTGEPCSCCSEECHHDQCACECTLTVDGVPKLNHAGRPVEANCGSDWSHCGADGQWYGCSERGEWFGTGAPCSATSCKCTDGADHLGNYVEAPCRQERAHCGLDRIWYDCSAEGGPAGWIGTGQPCP